MIRQGVFSLYLHTMSGLLKGLFLVFLLDQAFGYKVCRGYHSNSHNDQDDKYVIRCLNSEYCCEKGCCRKVYTIWYFWTLLLFVLFVSIIFCWWYKVRQRRQQVRIVRGNVIPMQVVQPYPQRLYRGPNQPVEVPAQYPAYQYPCYAPPPYSVAVDPGPTPQNQIPPAGVAPKP